METGRDEEDKDELVKDEAIVEDDATTLENAEDDGAIRLETSVEETTVVDDDDDEDIAAIRLASCTWWDSVRAVELSLVMISVWHSISSNIHTHT